MTLLNGRLPAAMLAAIPGDGHRLAVELVPQTRALLDAFAARFGEPLRITDAYRTYAEQIALKASKKGYAAEPGTSNHGWGRAIDFGSGVQTEGSAEHLWMKANAPRFGWSHPRWAEDHNPTNGQQEPWHWEAVPVPADAYATIEEDDMTAAFEADVRADLLQKGTVLNRLDTDLRGDLVVKGQQLASITAAVQDLPALDRDLRADLLVKGQQITSLTAAVSALSGLVAHEQGLDVEAVRKAVADAIAAGVHVTVSVDGGKS